jgi:bifunctional DNA-binding transcriptional regulator/antitoxin component of YhaV-PrlF toxin-antitoxin module
MSGESTLSSRYKISVPEAVRENMGRRPGQRTAFLVKSSGALMVSIPTREQMAGTAAQRQWAGISRPEGSLLMRFEDRSAWIEGGR